MYSYSLSKRTLIELLRTQRSKYPLHSVVKISNRERDKFCIATNAMQFAKFEHSPRGAGLFAEPPEASNSSKTNPSLPRLAGNWIIYVFHEYSDRVRRLVNSESREMEPFSGFEPRSEVGLPDGVPFSQRWTVNDRSEIACRPDISSFFIEYETDNRNHLVPVLVDTLETTKSFLFHSKSSFHIYLKQEKTKSASTFSR